MAVGSLPWWMTHPQSEINRRSYGWSQTMGPLVDLGNAYWVSDLVGKVLRRMEGTISAYCQGIDTGGAGPVPINGKINNKIAPNKNVIPFMTSYKASDSRWTPNGNLVFIGSRVTPDEVSSWLGLNMSQVYVDMPRIRFRWKIDPDHDFEVGFLRINMSTGSSAFGWWVSGVYPASGRQRNIYVDSDNWWPNGINTAPTSRQAVVPAIWCGDGGSQGVSHMTCWLYLK